MSGIPGCDALTFRDGRRLGYWSGGAPGGRSVVYLHGTPGCRLQARHADAVARRNGVRLVAPSRGSRGRPGGVGGSRGRRRALARDRRPERPGRPRARPAGEGRRK